MKAASASRRAVCGIGVVMLLAHCGTTRVRMAAGSTLHAQTAAAISRGVTHLWRAQATAETERSSPRASFEGDWDQFDSFRLGPVRMSIHDTGPFVPMFVCLGIQHVSAENAAALGIDDEDCSRARDICSRVVRLIREFETSDGTVAYWPEATNEPSSVADRLRARFVRAWLGGPSLHGALAPRGVTGFPPEFRVWPDPDCTVMSWVARSIDARLNGARWEHGNPLRVLAPYSFTGHERLSFPTAAVPPAGMYYTFCIPKNRPDIPRDVDLVVNCNILNAFAILGEGDSPEARQIIRWILETVRDGRHRKIEDATLYYRAENVLHSAVSRCCKAGGIKSLVPAVKTLAAEVRATAIRRKDGTVFWKGGSPVRATACAVLTLINNDPCDPLIEGAVRYLLAGQDSRSGCWHDHWVPLTQTTTGRIVDFRSDAAATALAIEALCRYQMDARPTG